MAASVHGGAGAEFRTPTRDPDRGQPDFAASVEQQAGAAASPLKQVTPRHAPDAAPETGQPVPEADPFGEEAGQAFGVPESGDQEEAVAVSAPVASEDADSPDIPGYGSGSDLPEDGADTLDHPGTAGAAPAALSPRGPSEVRRPDPAGSEEPLRPRTATDPSRPGTAVGARAAERVPGETVTGAAGATANPDQAQAVAGRNMSAGAPLVPVRQQMRPESVTGSPGAAMETARDRQVAAPVARPPDVARYMITAQASLAAGPDPAGGLAVPVSGAAPEAVALVPSPEDAEGMRLSFHAAPAPVPSGHATALPAMARADLGQSVAFQIASTFRGGSRDRPVEVILEPSELGRVRLSLTSSEGMVTVSVLAERPETLDLMRRNIGMLAQEFLRLGYQEAQFSFGSGQHGDSGMKPRGDIPSDKGRVPGAVAEASMNDRREAAVLMVDRLDLRL